MNFVNYEPIELTNEDLTTTQQPDYNSLDPGDAFSPYNFSLFTDNLSNGVRDAVQYVYRYLNLEEPESEEIDEETKEKESKKQEESKKEESGTESVIKPVKGKHPGYMSDKHKFARTLLSTYKRVLKKRGIDQEYAYVLTASAIMESGWGKSLSAPYNYGGVMASSKVPHTRSWTKNYRNGRLISEYSNFRNFSSMEDYCNYVVDLMNKKRYKLFDKYSPHDPVTAWYNILKSGYGGTNDEGQRKYARSVGSIVNQLKKY